MEQTTELSLKVGTKVNVKTLEEIVEFSNEAYLFMQKAESEGKGETKLIYAIKKLVGNPATRQKGILTKAIRPNQIKSRDIQIDYASVDAVTGNLLKDERGQYLYTKDNKKSLENALDELTNEPIAFEPYIATEVSEELSEYQKELFKGFVLK